MPAIFRTPVQLAGPAALTTIGDAVPAGKMRRYDLRACNITTAPAQADAWLDVKVKDNATPANSGYRAKAFLVPFSQATSAPDMEYGLFLTEGMELQVAANAVNLAAFSATIVEDDWDPAALTGVMTPVQITGVVGLTTIGGVVPAGFVDRVDLRACNIMATAGEALAAVYVNDTVTPANSGYRTRQFPIKQGDVTSAPDLEYGFPLTAGQELQVWASAANSIAFSLTRVRDHA